MIPLFTQKLFTQRLMDKGHCSPHKPVKSALLPKCPKGVKKDLDWQLE